MTKPAETIGREAQLAHLRAAIHRLEAGIGSATAVVGRAGMGKSHVLRETVRAASKLRPISGRATHTGHAEPYRPIVEAVSRAAADSDGASTAYHELVTNLVGMERPSAHRVTPTTLGEAMLTLCAGRLVILEDLHWADADTLAVVEYLADHASESGVAVVVSSRDDGDAMAAVRRAQARGVCDIVELGPLDVHHTALLASSIAGPTAERAARAIHRWSGGVPLIIQALASEASSLEAVVEGLPSAPDTFSDVVVERLNQLSDTDRQAINVAALLGSTIDVTEVAEVNDVEPRTVVAALRQAVDLKLVTGDGTSFDHALTRVAIVDRLLAFERRAIAERALDVLDDLEPARRAGLAREAGRLEEAAALLGRAGCDAAETGALASAEELLRQSLALVEESVHRVRLVEVLVQAGKASEALTETLDLQRYDDACRPRATRARARALRDAGRIEDAVRMLATTTRSGDTAEDAELTLLMASIRLESGDAEAASSLLAKFDDNEHELPIELRCESQLLFGRSRRGLLDFEGARTSFESAVELASQAGSQHRINTARFELGTIEILNSDRPDLLADVGEQAIATGALRLAAHADHLVLAYWTEILQPTLVQDGGSALTSRCRRLGLAGLERTMGATLACRFAVDLDHDVCHRWVEWVSEACDDDEWAALARLAFATHLMLTEDREGARRAFATRDRLLTEAGGLFTPWPHYGNLLDALEGEPVVRLDRSRRLSAAIDTAADAIVEARQGDADAAEENASLALGMVEVAPVVRALLQRYLGEAGLRYEFGRPARWLAEAIPVLANTRFDAVTAAAQGLATGVDPPDDCSSVPAAFAERGVTVREFEVVRLLVEGLSYAEIGARVHLSPRTVEGHVARVRMKLGEISRVELIVRASDVLGPTI